jgi:hypothetical protein
MAEWDGSGVTLVADCAGIRQAGPAAQNAAQRGCGQARRDPAHAGRSPGPVRGFQQVRLWKNGQDGGMPDGSYDRIIGQSGLSECCRRILSEWGFGGVF